MRTSVGLGLTVWVGLFACKAPSEGVDTEVLHPAPEPAPEILPGGDDGGVGGGADAGVELPVKPDGGSSLTGAYDAGTIIYGSGPGWKFYGPEAGGPRQVHGVSSDQGGNIWVAGGQDGLFLLPKGQERFRRFTAADGLGQYTDATGTHGYDVLSVAGGPSGTVFVGYQEGLYGGKEDNDPLYMVKSGDADEVKLNADGSLSVRHFDLATRGYIDAAHPDGRDKIRSVHRVVWNPKTGDVWFGGNHGVAMFDAKRKQVFEHQHVAINGVIGNNCSLLSGDWNGLSIDGDGNVWIGGGHRSGRILFSISRNFWADVNPQLDLWPDAATGCGIDERQRVDDYVQDMAAMPDGSVWVGSIRNSLARVSASGVSHLSGGLVDRKVTALEADPADGSLWVGHLFGGITRLEGGKLVPFDYRVLGMELINDPVPDIQSDTFGGTRRILVAFRRGAIGIYTGP